MPCLIREVNTEDDKILVPFLINDFMKNKSSLLVIAALCVLCAISYYLYKNKTSSTTLQKEACDFAVKDTNSITKIFLADKEGHRITLERKDKGWIVNGEYPCRPDAISLLLYTIRMVDVKSPVSKAAKEGIIKVMSAKSVKVEIYDENDLIKQYYVGHENQLNDGTYMILTDINSGNNYEDPYLTYIPGFNGFLSTRYFTDESDWRSHLVLNYIPPNIKSIKVEHLESPDSSFTVDLANSNTFSLLNTNGTKLSYDEVKMKQYLAYFQNVSFEKLLTKFNKKLSDSLRNAIPYIKLSITDTQNKTKVFSILHKNTTPELNERYGINYKYDPDRFFLRFDEDKEVALAQFYVFGKILPTYAYFQPKNTVKK